MGTKQYQLGLKHGCIGVRYLAHRKLKQYDGKSANRSYLQGYLDGVEERKQHGFVRLDYTNPLSNQWFGDKP